jgi:hypothetical protein
MNPFALYTRALMVVSDRFLAGSVENAVDSVLLLVVEDVMVGHTMLVLRRVLELLQLLCGQRPHRVSIDELRHSFRDSLSKYKH